METHKRSMLLLFCQFDMWYDMALRSNKNGEQKPMLNATCSRGAITCFLITERIENYIYKYYICICKDLYVHSHFYIGNISQI